MDQEVKIDSSYTPAGYQPDLSEWVSRQGYVPRNLIAIITRNLSPEDFQPSKRGEIEMMALSLKNILEIHALRIDGFRSGLEVDLESGEVTALGSAPVYYFHASELYGRPIEALMGKWIKDYLAPLFQARESLPDFETQLRKISLDVIFIEPDPTHTQVVRAWSCENFHPIGVRGEDGERDLARGGRLGMVSVRFKAAISQDSEVLAKAQTFLNGIVLAATNPYESSAFVDSIAAEVLKKRDQ